jgi:hypothetical protein
LRNASRVCGQTLTTAPGSLRAELPTAARVLADDVAHGAASISIEPEELTRSSIHVGFKIGDVDNPTEISGCDPVPVMLIARFDGNVTELVRAYDRAHALIGSRAGAVPLGELRHHCATSETSLYIIGVWESEDHVRRRWSSDEFRETLTSVGFPAPDQAEITILDLHAIEPPL